MALRGRRHLYLTADEEDQLPTYALVNRDPDTIIYDNCLKVEVRSFLQQPFTLALKLL